MFLIWCYYLVSTKFTNYRIFISCTISRMQSYFIQPAYLNLNAWNKIDLKKWHLNSHSNTKFWWRLNFKVCSSMPRSGNQSQPEDITWLFFIPERNKVDQETRKILQLIFGIGDRNSRKVVLMHECSIMAFMFKFFCFHLNDTNKYS